MERLLATLTIIVTLLTLTATANAYPTPGAQGLPSVYGTGQSPLSKWGGSVVQDPVVHLVFWGSGWRNNPIVPAETSLFRELAGTPYNGLLSQYGVHNDVRLAGVRFVPGTHPVTDKTVLALLRHRWRHATRNDLWILVTNLNTQAEFTDACGEHFQIAANKGPTYNVALIPVFTAPAWNVCIYDYSTDDGAVQPANVLAAETSIASHEYAEMTTDPQGGSGWATSIVFGAEIADLCYYYSGVPSGMTVNVSYLWSNALRSRVNGCAI